MQRPGDLGFIEHLRRRRIATLAMLQRAELDGLVDVDEENGTVAPATRLLLAFDGLHDYVAQIENRWAERDCDVSDHFASLLSRCVEDEGPTDDDDG